MRSHQIAKWGEPLVPRDQHTPQPTGSEVLIEVTACGVCHSDLHIHQGYFDLGNGKRLNIADRGMVLPFTMGHEVGGKVAALGPDAKGVDVGESYVVYPWIGCGRCSDCDRGDELFCTKPRVIGTWVHGGYSTHVVVPDARYLVAHGDVPIEVACTYACSGITAYSALRKTGLSRADQSLLLIGAGGVGTNGLLMAKSVLGCRVAVADVDPVKRDAAMETGVCDAVFDNASDDVIGAIKDWSGGGVHASIDFVGRPQTLGLAFKAARPKGSTAIVVGLYGDSIDLSIALLPLRVVDLRGSYVGTLSDLKAVIQLAKDGVLSGINVNKRPLEEVNQALIDLADGRVNGRIVLDPAKG